MLAAGERAALQFSGGKDSTALLYLARPYLDRITVYFAETGAVFSHVRRHVEETCDALGARLKVVLPPRPVQEHIDAQGLPSDLVPVEATLASVGSEKSEGSPFRPAPMERRPRPGLRLSFWRSGGRVL